MAVMEVAGALCCSVVFTAALGGLVECLFYFMDRGE
jgi:hypothetical protein